MFEFHFNIIPPFPYHLSHLFFMSIFRSSFIWSTSYHILCSSLSNSGSNLTSSLWARKSKNVLLQSVVKHLAVSYVFAHFHTGQLSGIARSVPWLVMVWEMQGLVPDQASDKRRQWLCSHASLNDGNTFWEMHR